MPAVKAFIALFAALAFLGGASDAAAKKRAPAPKRAEPKEKAAPAAASKEIELVHQLGADKGAQLQRLVDRFNAGSERKIVLSERDWRHGSLPALLLLAPEDETEFLAGKPRYKPLYQIMKEAREPLETLRPPAMMTPMPLDAAGRVIGLPIGLSTALMFYNRDALKKAGTDPDQPPKTWFELQQVLGKLYDSGMTCPYASAYSSWVHVDNTSAWHNEPMAASGKREGPLVVNNMLMVKHLAMMSSWYKSRYLHVFGRRGEAEAKFASGECAVLTAPSASFPTLTRSAGFAVGVAPLPYHDDIAGAPQNTLADGSTLWVAAGKKADEYRLIAKFVNFLLTPESQVEWQRYGGYLPLNRAGLLASSSELLKSDLVNVRTAIAELTHKPVTSSSRASRYAERADVRRILDEELEDLWAGRKPAKAALDDAAARSRALR
jgi:multiple sugar transport system substrate-binding protein